MIGAIIQARQGSKRLPGKMSLPIEGKDLLEAVIYRLKKVPSIDQIIVVTTALEADLKIEERSKALGVECFRASSEDVLGRYIMAARKYQIDHIIRVTGDCPLIDPEITEKVIELYQKEKLQFASNIRPPSYADGMDVEIIERSLLEEADSKANLPSEREHVVPYIRKRLDQIKYNNLSNPQGDESSIRLTIDTEGDYQALKELSQLAGGTLLDLDYQQILLLWKKLKNQKKLSNLSEERNQGSQSVLSKDEVFLNRQVKKSDEWLKRAEKVIPMGCQTFSKSPSTYPRNSTPFYIERGEGAYLIDLDGYSYLDLVLGLGPVTIGYNDPRVNEAISEQLKKGISATFSFQLEAELAESLVELIPSAEMVRFGKNGTDATSAAIRLSRAVTGKEHVLVCGYHGWQDWYIGSTNMSEGVPEGTKKLTHTVPYNQIESIIQKVEALEEKVACIILEPVQGTPPEKDFLHSLRSYTKENGIILIFDEIVSGFRVALGGGQEYYKVTPDLSTFGKGCANGMPLSFVVGKKELMKDFHHVFFSGTFGGEALSLAAAKKTIAILQEEKAPQHFWHLGNLLKKGCKQIFESLGLKDSLEMKGLSPHPSLAVSPDLHKDPLLVRSYIKEEVLKRGVIMGGAHNFSLSHQEEDILKACDALYGALKNIKPLIAQGRLEEALHGEKLKPGLRSI